MNRAVVLSNQRRIERDEVFHRTTVSIVGRTPQRALVVDLSPLGCMVRCEAAAERGQPISIALPVMGQLDGNIVWAIMGRIGMQFGKPIGKELYDSLLRLVKTP